MYYYFFTYVRKTHRCLCTHVIKSCTVVIFMLLLKDVFSGSAYRHQLFNSVAVALIADRRAQDSAAAAYLHPCSAVSVSKSDLWWVVANKFRQFVAYLPHNAWLCCGQDGRKRGLGVEAGQLDTEAETHLKQRSFSLLTWRKCACV